jgi:hypothetical protein
MTNSSEEPLLKVSDDGFCGISEFSEYWQDKRVLWQNVGLVERYLKGKISLHLHLRTTISGIIQSPLRLRSRGCSLKGCRSLMSVLAPCEKMESLFCHWLLKSASSL